MTGPIDTAFFDMGNTLLHFHEGETDDRKTDRGLRLLAEHLSRRCGRIGLEELRRCFYLDWMHVLPDRETKLVEFPVEPILNQFLERYGMELSLEECREAMGVFFTEYPPAEQIRETARKLGARV